MKKILLTMINLFVLSAGINSSKAQNFVSGYVDYSFYNDNDTSRFFRFNSNYTAADSGLNYACMAINQLVVYTDYVDSVPDLDFAGQNVWAYSGYDIDSVFIFLSHENNSGQYNVFGFDIVKLNIVGSPTSTSQILWSYRDSVNTSLSPSGNWQGNNAMIQLKIPVNYHITSLDKAGIKFIYQAPFTDTLGIVGSCIKNANGGTSTQSSYYTSFISYPPFISGITANKNVGYGTPNGSAGWFEAQDWEISARITTEDPTAVEEKTKLGFSVQQNFPNPCTENTLIKFSLLRSFKNVHFELSDVSGKTLYEQNLGKLSAGEHSMHLSGSPYTKGIYFYTFNIDGVKVTRRMIIQ